MPEKKIPKPTFRKEWQVIKKVVKACGVDLSSATSDKPGFGKAVDAYEAAVAKYMDTEGDNEKLQKQCAKLGKAASNSGAKYLMLIHRASEDISAKVKAGTATPDEVKAEDALRTIDMKLAMLTRDMLSYSKKHLS